MALKLVVVTLVKIPAAGVVRPIEEPLMGEEVMEPPLMVKSVHHHGVGDRIVGETQSAADI